jgi:uncharacterized membrane protein YeaQ/YmgE (transglycosylase-associated protein family)
MSGEHEPTKDELEQRLRHLLGEEAAEAVPKPVDAIDARLSEIEEKAKKIRANSPTTETSDWNLGQPDASKGASGSGLYYRDLGFGMTVLYALVGPLVAGFGVGYLIDRRTPGSTTGQLWGTVIGAVFVTISKHERSR